MRRLVGAIALAAVVTTGAQAQSPFTANFTANGDQVGSGHDFAAYGGTFNGADESLTGVLNATMFQIFCVDKTHFFAAGDTYDVWVTPMSSSDFSHTRAGAGTGAQYFAAANIASNMQAGWPTTPESATNDNQEYAIWQTLGLTVPTSETNYDAPTIANDIRRTETPARESSPINGW